MLPWHQPEPRRQLPPILESTRIADAGHQRTRGQRTDAGNRFQPTAGLILAVPGLDLVFQLPYLHTKLTEVREQSREERPTDRRQSVLHILQNLRI